MSQWVDCNERLPDVGEKILICAVKKNGEKNIYTARRIYCEKCRKVHWELPSLGFFIEHKITHWMPLPEMPKEVTT